MRLCIFSIYKVIIIRNNLYCGFWCRWTSKLFNRYLSDRIAIIASLSALYSFLFRNSTWATTLLILEFILVINHSLEKDSIDNG